MSASFPLTGPRLRVLVVDDFDGHASSTALMLSAFGYEADYALDGRTALDKAKSFAPDVVLLDLGLPRMSGYEVADRLANGWTVRPPVIVAVTGWSRDEDRRKSLAAGFHLHLAKPVEPHTLFGILERIRDGVGVGCSSEWGKEPAPRLRTGVRDAAASEAAKGCTSGRDSPTSYQANRTSRREEPAHPTRPPPDPFAVHRAGETPTRIDRPPGRPYHHQIDPGSRHGDPR